ncbi:CopG family transcriptional regulator [Candidatus Nitrosacidococcus sp. I8]|uniref:type II toxin-antitoxin system RelB family antitoxin n=1 Tax=Candidatus Nitrosacidococcus sp. I8 TaxID=2942908 RepID=UPI002226000A|nr:CopG family transcriptional regulator [Candidatus Nitrosacidococcus sp. I8]CAH9017978.1 hypothetical protein NURINAE_00659 [Candidatus Nitrosacidococcus sp. I8]
MIKIELPKNIETRLAVLAKTTGHTEDYYIREAITEYLDSLEDLHLAEQRLAEIRAGHGQWQSLEDLEKNIDLEN